MNQKVRQVKVAAILDTMWVGEHGKAPRWFKINPENHSGRRLYKLIDSLDLLVTNACPQCVEHSRQHGVPDAAWLQENLKRISCKLLLVCGKVAQQAFESIPSGDWPNCKVLFVPHPAARTWTKSSIALVQKQIQEALA